MKSVISFVFTLIMISSPAEACLQGPGSYATALKLPGGRDIGTVTEVISPDRKSSHMIVYFEASGVGITVTKTDYKGQETQVRYAELGMFNGGSAFHLQGVLNGGETLKVVARSGWSEREFVLSKPATRGCNQLTLTSAR